MNLYWQEEKDDPGRYEVPDDIVDIHFKVRCKSLPLDHNQALSDAIHTALPWVADEEDVAIPAIHVAESGNGWMRPDDPENEVLYLSRRTRMSLRVPSHRIDDTRKLAGRTLDIAGNPLEVGEPSEHKLSKLTTIFCRYLASPQAEDEPAFLKSVYEQLQALGVKPRKMLTGKLRRIRSHEGDIDTRSLLLAELDIEESILLQQKGLGPARKLGCGIFLPHKGIEAVRKIQDEKT